MNNATLAAGGLWQEPAEGEQYRPTLSDVADVLDHIDSLLNAKLNGEPMTTTNTSTGARRLMRDYEVFELVAEMVANVKDDIELICRELSTLTNGAN